MLDDSLAQVQGRLDATRCDQAFEICVNITLDDLRRKRFVHGVFGALEASGVEPRHLCLELTEQTMLADGHGANTVVAELRRAGIRIAIADRLGMWVTAEGIEERDALEYLRDRGCGQGQGFLFSPAVPAAEFAPAWTWASLR